MVLWRTRRGLVSPHRWTRQRPAKKPVIVLAGEDSHDRKVLRIFLEAVCPNARGRIVEINDILRFRAAGDAALIQRATKLAGRIRAVTAREQAEVACVFIHEDFDAVDSPQRDATRRRVQEALRRNFARTYYVLATWEVEAWLLLFPDAISAVNSSWVVPNRYHGRDTGRIMDPKRVMMREVSKTANSRYEETDAPKVFEKIVELDQLNIPSGSNQSYSELQQSASDCCGVL
jgi:hypothetical protein